MRVLHGQVTVQGYIAQPSSEYMNLYAPYNHQAIVIDTLDPLHAELAYVKRQVPAQSEDEEDELKSLIMTHVTKKHAAVIALRAMDESSDKYQSTALFRHLFEYPARRVTNTEDADSDANSELDSAYDPLELGDMHVVSQSVRRVKQCTEQLCR